MNVCHSKLLFVSEFHEVAHSRPTTSLIWQTLPHSPPLSRFRSRILLDCYYAPDYLNRHVAKKRHRLAHQRPHRPILPPLHDRLLRHLLRHLQLPLLSENVRL